MKEICEHIIDIVNNSIAAGADVIEIDVEENTASDLLKLSITDNGKGIDSDTIKNISDPFYTTKSTKKIGMGTSLLKFHAELTGGDFIIESYPGKGTLVRATFGLSHVDRQPLGDITGTLLLFLSGNPDVHLIYKHATKTGSFTFDSVEVKDALGGVKLNRPEVRNILRDFIQSNLNAISTIGFTK